MTATIRLSQVQTNRGDRIEANPTTRLGDQFGDYLRAMSRVGGRYDPERRCQWFASGSLQEAIRAIREAGFSVEVDEHLGAKVRAAEAALASDREAARQLHDAAVERMEEVDRQLAARGLALYPYQRDGVRWLSHRKGAGLFDEMGLGKTVQALIAAPEDAPILVVAPAAVKGVWVKETRRWRPDLGWPRPLSGRNSFRWPKSGEIVVTNYDILPPVETDEPSPGARPRHSLPDWVRMPAEGTLLVFDECHALKNPSAKRTHASRMLAARVRAASGRVWGLTGTPLLNRPVELWHVLKVMGIAEEAYGSYRSFSRMFDFAGNPLASVSERLREVSLMRRRLEVLPDLPTKVYQEIAVEIDPDTRRLADDLIRSLEAAGLSLANVDSIAELVGATRNAQLDIGQIARVRAALAQAKTGRLVELAEEHEAQGKPLVVFSAHRAPVQLLAEREGWEKITGDEAGMARTGIVDRFAAGALKGLACTIRAAGVGIDGLQKASHDVVFVDLDWTPGMNQQAEDRVCRIGQDRGVNITVLVANHALDDKVTELLSRKARIIEGAVNASARSTVEEQFPSEAPEDAVTVRTEAEHAQRAQAEAVSSSACLPMGHLWARFAGVVASGISRPTLRMQGFELKMAGSGSRYKGQIMVTNGKPWGHPDNVWYGRIDGHGFWRSRSCPEKVAKGIAAWDQSWDQLMRDAIAYGHETGRCSFCGLELTDGRSVSVGYGPICAQKWGLPWGDQVDTEFPIPSSLFSSEDQP